MFGHQTPASSPENTQLHFATLSLQELEKQIELAESAEDVKSMLNNFLATMNTYKHPADIQATLDVVMQEACIKAFIKLSKLNKNINEFSEHDMACLRKAALCLNAAEDGQSDRYFIPYTAEHIDRSIAKQFPQGHHFLDLMQDQFHADMINILLGWVKAGLLDGKTKVPALQELTDKWKLWESEQPEGLYNEIIRMAIDKRNILDFVTENIFREGWKPWFQVVEYKGEKHSLIAAACKHQGINLRVYTQDESGSLIHTHAICGDDGTVDNQSDPNKPSLHVLYGEQNNQLFVLDEITTPSHLYRRMAVRISGDLLQENPLNACALEVASDKGLTVLPQIARKLAEGDKLEESDSKLMVDALGSFINSQKDDMCQHDKLEAEEARKALEYKMQGGFFTNREVAAFVVKGIAASIGLGFVKLGK